jgi:intracellular septation protein
MQMLFEFLPLLAFFVAYKFGGIYVATGVLVAAVVIQASIEWIRRKRVSPMLLTSAGLAVVFGGLTIYLHDPEFIKLKPTLLYWLFSAVFIGSQFIGQKTIPERVLGEALAVPRPLWIRANLLFALFFFALGAVNLYVAKQFSEEHWVYFKFVMFGALAVFTFAIAFWLASKAPNEDSAPKEPNP